MLVKKNMYGKTVGQIKFFISNDKNRKSWKTLFFSKKSKNARTSKFCPVMPYMNNLKIANY